MIRNANKLAENAENFADTHELASQLDALADDDDIPHDQKYYLRECASHMRGMYALVREMARALKAKEPSAPTSN